MCKFHEFRILFLFCLTVCIIFVYNHTRKIVAWPGHKILRYKIGGNVQELANLTTTTSTYQIQMSEVGADDFCEVLDIFQLIPSRWVRYSLIEAIRSKRIRESETIFSALVDCADRLGDVLHWATITSPQTVIRPNLEDDRPWESG